LNNFLTGLTDKTIIMVTHDFDTGAVEGQKIIIFDNGPVVFDDIWKNDSVSFKEYYKRLVAK